MSLYKKISENVYEIDILNASKSDLYKISKDRSLGLNLNEMRKIQEYFRREGRNPTDVEIEAFAQAWSEHCCYKTSRPILKETIFKTKAPQNICVISEDAGVVEFNKEYAYVVALESHNHPSALDPYGGAATGIGGILRDVLCMGAKPIALVDPLFFGYLDYPYKKIPEGVKHPKFLFRGVISGISAYGNRVGIPTVAGMVEFDETYIGNCLVNVGCIGIVKKDNIIHSRAENKNDVYIMAGGKTGRDGIHGVTFASSELDEESEKRDIPAVQLGYAIMKEPLIHACLEANEKKLLTGLKDFGGGGLSCVSSEMAYAGNKGAVIYIDKVPLKEEGLSPWEIWVSESQERMMMTVKPENVDKVLEIFDFWDVPAVIVGEIDESRRIKAFYKGVKVLDLDMNFLLRGVVYKRRYKIIKRDYSEKEFKMPNLEDSISKVLNSQRIGSRACIIRRYDYEVKGNTVLKPMQGLINKQTHGDAAVIKPLKGSYRGLSITTDVNPKFCKLDPYWGAASAVEEVIRNLVSVNSIPHSMADCLNFGNPEREDRLGDFVRCCEGLYFAANSFGIPFISGNVSFYNEGVKGSVAPTPTLLGIGIVKDVRGCITTDLKRNGNSIYLIGETRREMGASEYYRIIGIEGGIVPRVYPEKTKENIKRLLKLMNLGLIKSCHDISTGGLIVSLAEMSFGGDLGAEIDLSPMGKLRTDFKLFSESNGRWLVEVGEDDREEFEDRIDAIRIGEIIKEKTMEIKDKNMEISLDLELMRERWMSAIEMEE